MRKIALKITCLAFCLLFVSGNLFAWWGGSAQALLLRIDAVFLVLFEDASVNIELGTPVPGGLPPDAVVNTSYGIYYTSLSSYKLVVGFYDFPPDPNLQFIVNVEAPTGAVSAGNVVFTSADAEGPAGEQACVTSIDPVNETGLQVTYTLHCTGVPAPMTQYMTVFIEFAVE